MATKGTATIDFGTGGQRATVTVSTPVVTGSYIEAWFMSDTSVDHSDYEHQMANMVCKFTCGEIVNLTSFVAVATSTVTLQGVWTFRWVWDPP